MRNVYVLGGQQSRSVEEYEGTHKKGVIVRVDLETGRAETCVEHVSPSEVRADDTAIIFKAGTLESDRLYACTETEVFVYALPEFEQISYLSLPLFNDVHHVRPTASGTLLIANTGLDMVLEATPGGEILREWNVLGKEPWVRFSKDVDYRKVASTKPHEAHPNYVFFLDEDIWVTRFEQRDAVCLTGRGQRMKIDIQRPHDGTVHGDFVYFTTVDGHVIVVDKSSHQVEEMIDLNSIHNLGSVRRMSTALGWCRALAVSGSKVWVGFSRFRDTQHKENISWVRRNVRGLIRAGQEPTRIACYDLSRKEFLTEIDLEPAGLDAVFSILPEAEDG